MKNLKKQETKQEQPQKKPKMRQVILETDGTNIHIAKAEVAGSLELMAILSSVLNKIQNPSK